MIYIIMVLLYYSPAPAAGFYKYYWRYDSPNLHDMNLMKLKNDFRASINHGRTMDETWTIHGQLASILAAQRLRHALSRKRCAARSIGVHERPWHINVPKSHFYELIF